MMLGIGKGIKRIALVAVLSLPAGCGFQLAGSGSLPAGMSATYLDSAAPRSEFSSSLTEAFRSRGVDLVDSRSEAGATLVISEDLTGQRVLSVSTRNIPREYEVYYSITFALEVGGQALIEPEYLIARRNYTYDETEVLGRELEESQLRRALADDLARQVVRRIEAVAAAPARTPG
jgi:LPS-assembly lipoprotein